MKIAVNVAIKCYAKPPTALVITDSESPVRLCINISGSAAI